MTLSVNPEDRFWKDVPNPQEPSRFSGLLRYLLGVVFLIGIGIGGWKLYSLICRPTATGVEVPLIKADEAPYKVKAENQEVPGIHHQDKLVYGRMGGSQGNEAVEHILPEPEAPAVIQMTEQYRPHDMDLETPPQQPVDNTPPPAAPTFGSIEDLLSAEATPAPEAETPPAPAPEGDIFIQLGSLKSQELAESEWARALKKTDVLGKREPLIQKVDLGEDQGIYYRLRTGPFESMEAAQKACAALKEEKVDCIIVKTSGQ